MSAELVAIIKTYPWQCMECKTCIICGQPHHEEEMMFCDVCDRGYHTFCVGLGAIPSGNYRSYPFLKYQYLDLRNICTCYFIKLNILCIVLYLVH